MCLSHYINYTINIPIILITGPGVGANTAIPLGISSTILRPSDAIQMGCCPSSPSLNNEYENPKMPFIKKWVRTRHAILFRLSNKTVQVLFFDRRFVLILKFFSFFSSHQTFFFISFFISSLMLWCSEVLLSSEARMVTYVNKQNVRSDHTLEEVLQTGGSIFRSIFYFIFHGFFFYNSSAFFFYTYFFFQIIFTDICRRTIEYSEYFLFIISVYLY